MTVTIRFFLFLAAKLQQKHKAVFSKNPYFSELEIYLCVNVL